MCTHASVAGAGRKLAITVSEHGERQPTAVRAKMALYGCECQVEFWWCFGDEILPWGIRGGFVEVQLESSLTRQVLTLGICLQRNC